MNCLRTWGKGKGSKEKKKKDGNNEIAANLMNYPTLDVRNKKSR